jgi:hypothetical protein
MDKQRLKPTESKILDVLSDGELHLNTELHGCLYDDLGPLRERGGPPHKPPVPFASRGEDDQVRQDEWANLLPDGPHLSGGSVG